MKVKANGIKYDLNEDNSASGGEGVVYFTSGLAFKIYHDPKKMIPIGKLKELSSLNKDNIIKPLDLVYNLKDEIIGYTMNHINNTVSLSRLVTTDYQNQNNITNKEIVNVIQQMRETLSYIHSKNKLVVDVNDSNILIDKNLKVFFIDVDSYQTESYPATAIQEFAKDFSITNNKFTIMSDWYSFSLLAVKLFIGIHPYKGRWNKYNKRANENTLKERSINNISIFNDDVILPNSVRDLSLIPKNYYDYFIDIFEKGKRLIPPENLSNSGYSKKEILLKSTSKLNIIKLVELQNVITNVINGFRKELINTIDGVYFEGNKTELSFGNKAFIFNNDQPFIMKEENGNVSSYDLKNRTKEHHNLLFANEVFSFNNILYTIHEDKINEIGFLNMGKQKLIIEKTFNINKNQMELHDGVIIQKLMGKTFTYILGEKNKLPTLSIKEFNNIKIINAKYINKVLMVTSLNKLGGYDVLILKINDFMDDYKIVDKYESDSPNINFTVNDKGVVILIKEDGLINILFNNFKNDKITEVKDDQIRTDMKLFSDYNVVKFFHGKSIYSISMN